MDETATDAVPLPLLVTGISGVAGWNAFRYFSRKYPGKVVGIRPLQNVRLNGPGIIGMDSGDVAGLDQLFRQWGFRSVLNAAGNCALKVCEIYPELAWRTNVESARAIARVAQAFGARLIHLSSDLVYSGKGSGNYVETDPTDPVTVYGKTMAEAEEWLLAHAPDTAILRISLPMGPSFSGHAGAIDWIRYRFKNGWPATLYFDEVRSCTYTDDLNAVFEIFLAQSWRGVFHAGGPRPLALYQIAQLVNRVGDYEPALLKGCPRRMAAPIPPRAGNVSMCSTKLVLQLGKQPFRPWPFGRRHWPGHRRWHYHRPEHEIRGPKAIATRLYHYADSDIISANDNRALAHE